MNRTELIIALAIAAVVGVVFGLYPQLDLMISAPFSAIVHNGYNFSPRICIGATFALQEAMIVVATVMRHFTLELAPGHAVWPGHRVTLRPGGGLPMIVMRRWR